MRETDLPSPDIGAKGHHLRRIAVSAISSIEVNTYGNGRHPAAVSLKAFLDAALAAVTALLPAVTVPVFAPTAKSYSQAAGATVGPVLDKAGHTGAVTYSSATPAVATVNPNTGFVTAVAASGTSVITATLAANGGFAQTTKTYVATATA